MVKKSTTNETYVTADEAVARLINLPSVPITYSLLDMTGAFLEEAEVNLANASSEKLTSTQYRALENKKSVCQLRHELGTTLLDAIRKELQREKPRLSLKTGTVVGLLNWQSVRSWASDEFELEVSAASEPIEPTEASNEHAKFSEKLLKHVGPRGWGRTKTIYLLVTFYFLLFEYAKKNPKNFLNHGELSPDPLSVDIAEKIAKTYPQFGMYGQRTSTIKLRIQAAREASISAVENR